MLCQVGGVRGCNTPQWNDEGTLSQTFSDRSPNIGYESTKLPFQWLICPHQLCRGSIPVTKVFDSLISVVEGPHFIACVLCSPSMKRPCFSDQSTYYQLRRAPFSVIKVHYTSYKRPLFQKPKSPYLLKRVPTSVIKVPVYFGWQKRRLGLE